MSFRWSRWIVFILFFAPYSVFADTVTIEVSNAIPQGPASIGVGSGLKIKFTGERKVHSGLFLGQLVGRNGRSDQVMFLDRDRSRILVAPRNEVSLKGRGFQKIVNPYAQVDGTCTAYAMNHLIEQISVNGVSGNESLRTTLSSEEGRTQFLVRTINDYYIASQHHFSIKGILNGYGREFGLRCEMKQFKETLSAQAYVADKVLSGVPVLISFFIGPNMITTDLPLSTLAPVGKLDDRLWIPRKVGERESGGHSVVAVAAFQAKGKNRFLMLDSDWSEPRVWDIEQTLGGRTAIDEIEFYSCQ